MENSITLKDIEKTGYTTWQDFYFKKENYSGRNDDHTYTFLTTDNKMDTITLKLPPKVLDSLVIAEAKIPLQFIGVKTFSELKENHKDKIRNRDYVFDVIYKDKEDQISYKKIIFPFDRVVELTSLENRIGDYLFFEEKKNL
jgi:hypothetical protein